jgi:hypothetical protein
MPYTYTLSPSYIRRRRHAQIPECHPLSLYTSALLYIYTRLLTDVLRRLLKSNSVVMYMRTDKINTYKVSRPLKIYKTKRIFHDSFPVITEAGAGLTPS